ncbi:MAG: MFS transporter [Proteobacteria bacterium]|nr:MFS transporter [Pseudomonadota bacterium]
MTQETAGKAPKRAIYATYAAGLFGNGLTDMMNVAVPLWALTLGASATEIGIIVGARNVLPLFLAIHGGVLMDRMGTRRVMFFFAAMATALAPLYPALPWLPALVVLQMFIGLATILTWVGAQTLIVQLTGGDTAHLGRFTFVTRIGTFSGPILIGVMWDLLGPWGAFSFAGVWGLGLLASIRMIPDAKSATATDRPALRARELVPRVSEYVRSFALLGLPAVALAVGISLLRSTTSGIQDSFYVVYLQQAGMTGTTIGALIAMVEISSGLGSLTAGQVARFMRPHWALIGFSILAVSLIAITPLLGAVFAVLALVQLLRGGCQGLILPIILSSVSKAVGPGNQGRAMGLRMTGNRLAATIIPVIMGVIADAVGVGNSFFIVGGVVIGLLFVTALLVHRSGAFAGPPGTGTEAPMAKQDGAG